MGINLTTCVLFMCIKQVSNLYLIYIIEIIPKGNKIEFKMRKGVAPEIIVQKTKSIHDRSFVGKIFRRKVYGCQAVKRSQNGSLSVYTYI